MDGNLGPDGTRGKGAAAAHGSDGGARSTWIGPPPYRQRMALEDIEHIVVLVLENRSFDHFLGYLALEGYTDATGARIDGLDPSMGNRDSHSGEVHKVHRLEDPRFSPGPA